LSSLKVLTKAQQGSKFPPEEAGDLYTVEEMVIEFTGHCETPISSTVIALLVLSNCSPYLAHAELLGVYFGKECDKAIVDLCLFYISVSHWHVLLVDFK
jgi:hypothetical protein